MSNHVSQHHLPKILPKIKLSKIELTIIIKTFLLDLLYVFVVVGILFNLAYLLLGIFIEPLSQATAEVYAIQQAQGISQDAAITLAGQSDDASLLWLSFAKIILLAIVTLCIFIALSTYFKSCIWSLLRRKPYISPLRFSALTLLSVLCLFTFISINYFTFQGVLAQVFSIVCILLLWTIITAFRFFYNGNLSIKENIQRSIRQMVAAERSPRIILSSLVALFVLIIIINIPFFATAAIPSSYSFYLSVILSLLLFSFLRWYFVRSMECVLDATK